MNTVIRLARKSTKYTTYLLVVSLFLAGCKQPDNSNTAALVTVQAEKPEKAEISEHIMADASLSPLAQAAIAPKLTAPVRKFFVQRGSKVKEGDLLAVLENRDLAAQVVDNKGQFDAAEAAYSMQTKAQVPEDYRKAELDMAQAKAQLQLQEGIVAARKRLLDEGAIAGRDYDTAVAALVQARATFDVAQNHFSSLQNVSREATLKQAAGQLSSAKGKYLAAEAQVSYSEIRSPISGVVTDRPLFAGETANTGSPLITVMDTSALLAKVHLAQTVAQRLSLGDEASILVPGVSDPVPAKVSLISPALDPGSTTVEVWLRLDNKAGKYKAGTPVRTSITGRTIPNAIKIPLTAVLTGQDGSKSVMVVGSDGVAHKKGVQLGINDGEDVQITQGLTGSEMVITTGAYGLDDGTKVTIGKPDAGGEDK
ncbi:efflux RND transporter periplasmic adaptor subunit [Edaphobacter sp. 4G125]|nr:efflux RND transporter periplasmic adaptor subunit [Edaphobacter sp. 4G125]